MRLRRSPLALMTNKVLGFCKISREAFDFANDVSVLMIWKRSVIQMKKCHFFPFLKPEILVLVILLCLVPRSGQAFQRKPDFILRVHQETSETDGEAFAIPAERASGDRRKTFISRIPLLSERDITAVYPFKADDGSNAVALQLRPHGRLALGVASAESLGRCFLIYANGRQLPDVFVDSRVEDGIFVIPGGLTDEEIAKLVKLYPRIGATKKSKKK